MIRVALHWRTMGPYHFARMGALARQPGIDLTVVESVSQDDHFWERRERPDGFELLSGRSDLARTYAEIAPDVIVTCGYSSVSELVAAFQQRRAKRLFWTESTSWDANRGVAREWLKRRIVRRFDGAIAAGAPHARYARELGVRPDRVVVAGGCVDNARFSNIAETSRAASRSDLPRDYFVFVGRLVEQKNVATLLRAHKRHVEARGAAAWDLVCVGDGPLRANLESVAGPRVHFLGTRQLEDLASIYAHAHALVLPSTVEPWGLVVNEAMACGTPVLVSDRCGCAEDLVVAGETGLTFSPDSDATFEALERAWGDTDALRQMAKRGTERVAAFTPERMGRESAALIREVVRRP